MLLASAIRFLESKVEAPQGLPQSAPSKVLHLLLLCLHPAHMELELMWLLLLPDISLELCASLVS